MEKSITEFLGKSSRLGEHVNWENENPNRHDKIRGPRSSKERAKQKQNLKRELKEL